MEMIKDQCNYCNRKDASLVNSSCGHHFCLKCIIKLFLFECKTLMFYYEEEITLTCLLCKKRHLKMTRKEIHKICSLEYTPDLIQMPVCQGHKKEVGVFEMECKVSMCEDCFDQHAPDIEGNRHDSVKHPKMFNSICMEHKMVMDNFCVLCCQLCCQQCEIEKHNGHCCRPIPKCLLKNSSFVEHKLPYETLEECSNYLTKEDIKIRGAINKFFRHCSSRISSEDPYFQTLEDAMRNLNEEWKINYEITRILMKIFYEEIEATFTSKLFNVNFFSKLPDFPHSLDLTEGFYKNAIKRIHEIKKKIEKLEEEKQNTQKNKEKIIRWQTNDDQNLIQLEDGKLASISSNLICIWDPQNNYQLEKTLKGHEDDVTCFLQLKDGRLASGSIYEIRLWDPLKNYKCVRTLKGQQFTITCLIQLNDEQLASGSRDNNIRVWNLKNSKSKVLKGHQFEILKLIQLNDGLLASCSSDSVRLWDPLDDYKCTKTLDQGRFDSFEFFIQLKDGLLASCSSDSIRLWDPLFDYICIKKLNSPSVKCLIQLEDGRLASGSDDGTIRLWDPFYPFNCTQTLEGLANSISILIQLEDGRLASGSKDGSIMLLDPLVNFNCIQTLEGHTETINHLIRLEDGKFATSSQDGIIQLWS